jgi:FAD/FMN-containing dehydrogenase
MGAMHQTDDGVYVNFLADEGEARVRAAYPGGTYERLAEIKRRYDPEGRIVANHGVSLETA